MRLSEIIKKYRTETGLSQRQFALKCKGLSNGYISMIENECNPATGKPIIPSIDKLKLIADAMNISLGNLIEIADDMDVSIATEEPSIPSNLTPIHPGSGQRIRVVGEIAAGKPIYMDEDYETYVDSPMKADFALIVRGDSMVPTYLDGDVVYIKQQSSVDDGQVAAVAVDDSATLKHVYKWNGGLNLVSDNPRYAPIHVNLDEQDVRVLGVVVGFTRMYAANNKLSGVTKGMPVNQP